jgi:sirohydrochlorin ferrochelatase
MMKAHSMTIGLIIVDHGSRSSESNELLHAVADSFANRYTNEYSIVEPAHMELAEPTIAQAYANCVSRGAEHIVVCPYFLGPGKHWRTDIPRLAVEAALPFSITTHVVAAPLGIDDLLLQLLNKRVHEVLPVTTTSHDN